METIPASPMHPLDLIGELIYINYAANRDASNITPKSWEKVYGEAAVAEFEARYQAEKQKRAA